MLQEADSAPSFYNLLNPKDQAAFIEMRAALSAPDHRYNRNKRICTFNEMLETIHAFCQKNDADDWKRSLVCGICWLDNGQQIAVNTRQLRLLLGKSKSSINGAFAKMGYETVPSKTNDSIGLVAVIPILKSNFNESRQWTTRKRIAELIECQSKPQESSPLPEKRQTSLAVLTCEPFFESLGKTQTKFSRIDENSFGGNDWQSDPSVDAWESQTVPAFDDQQMRADMVPLSRFLAQEEEFRIY